MQHTPLHEYAIPGSTSCSKNALETYINRELFQILLLALMEQNTEVPVMSRSKDARSPQKRVAQWVAEIVALAVARRVIRRIIRKF